MLLNVASCQSPTLNISPVGLEHHKRLQLCQAVSQLLIGRALKNGKLATITGIPEPVPLSQEVFGPVSDTLFCHQVICALIVFNQTQSCCPSLLVVEKHETDGPKTSNNNKKATGG